MLGGGGNPAAWWDVGSERTAHDTAGSAGGVERFGQGNSYIGVEVATHVSPSADAWWAPIDTISNSESGFERVYQGSALLLSWPIDLGPGERVSVSVAHDVTASRDRSEEDAEDG
jgi:alpha-amylase